MKFAIIGIIFTLAILAFYLFIEFFSTGNFLIDIGLGMFQICLLPILIIAIVVTLVLLIARK